ncbi:MAG: fused MFS/spermidine synthase [Proteobacteria bacterium]|nr:fused MFS/spermidine synthase [Pseudomonadota bacterium]
MHAALIVGALGGAAAMIAAGWEGEGRPPPMRYAFLGLAAAHALLVIWIAFHVDAYFARHTSAQGEVRLELAQPWTILVLITSFLLLTFAVHGTIQRRRDSNSVGDFAIGAAMPTLVFLILLALIGSSLDATKMIVIGLGFCCIAILLNRGKPIMMGAVILISFLIIFFDEAMGSRIITQERSFFGVLRTRVIDDSSDPRAPALRILMHGTTIHGAQLAAPGFSRMPLTYYNPHTALGDAIVAGLATRENSSLALIGLGAGSTACLMRPSDRLTIFEIDPNVVRLSAMPGGDFTYVPECQPHADIRLGDARLQIANEPDNSYNVIVVDAFTSDAIPAHLLTREALALYLRKATPDGIVILHLSNRNLALVSEAARVARDLHVPALYRLSDRVNMPYTGVFGGLPASVMIVARDARTLSHLRLQGSDWRLFPAPPGAGWTDDYINMARALWEGLDGAENCRISPYVEGCERFLTPAERAAAMPAATVSPSPAPPSPRHAP